MQQPDRPQYPVSARRTTFNGRRSMLFVAIIHALISLALLAGAVLFWVEGTYLMEYAIGVLMAFGGLIGLLVSYAGIEQWRKPFHVSFTTDGIDVSLHGHRVRLLWSDIASVRITDRWANGGKMPWRRNPLGKHVGTRTRWLVADPAEHVDDPKSELRNLLWQERWGLCATHTVDIDDEQELLAAIAATAPPEMSVEVDPIERRRY
jgi:hypothetical protein